MYYSEALPCSSKFVAELFGSVAAGTQIIFARRIQLGQQIFPDGVELLDHFIDRWVIVGICRGSDLMPNTFAHSEY